MAASGSSSFGSGPARNHISDNASWDRQADPATAVIAIGVLLGLTLGVVALSRHFFLRRARETRALRESERQFRLLINGMFDYAIYMLDTSGRVTNWNSGAERIEGYRAEEILGQHFSIFYTSEEQAAGEPDLALAIALARGRHETEGWRLRKDGSRFWASVVLDAVEDEDGKLIGFAKITRDISEKHAVEDKLVRTRQQLTQTNKMEAIGQLTGGVAHDFNNVLTVITASFEFLQRRLVGDDKVQRYIHAGLDAATRGAALTSRLLAFSRQQTLVPTPCEVNRLVPCLVDLVCRTFDEPIKVKTVLATGLWMLKVDTNQLQNALLNLVRNAYEAMPDAGTVTIETANAYLDDRHAMNHADVVPGHYVLISVSDTGRGLAKDLVPRVFDPFFTTKPFGIGTGLGLSQVYGFVKQSGGHAFFHSEIGRGTTVNLYFPRYLGEVPTAATSDPQPSPDVVQGGKVLVVEDDEAVRQFSVEGLRELGYSVLEADGAASALGIIESNADLAVLITDVVMPDVNGCKLAEAAVRRSPGLKVLFMSGYTGAAALQNGALMPGRNFLAKPFTLNQLAEKLRDSLCLPANAEH